MIFAAVESFVYSLVLLITAEENCVPKHSSIQFLATVQFIDRFINYQSWFIPLIWLYWPTKAHKRENRSRRKAIETLTKTKSANHVSREINDDLESEDLTNTDADLSDDGYSSLDCSESYLDYRTRSNMSNITTQQNETSTVNTKNIDNKTFIEEKERLIAENNNVGYGKNADIFIVGSGEKNRQMDNFAT